MGECCSIDQRSSSDPQWTTAVKVKQRVIKLEGDTERLRNERERLKRDLKEQREKKSQLESEVEQCRQRTCSWVCE